MKRRVCFYREQSNRGYSLVEVLVASAILLLITVPLLTAFIISARISAKARNIQMATEVAQSIMEDLKNTDIVKVYDDFLSDTVNCTASMTNGTTMVYNLTKDNVSLYTGGRTYYVTIDAESRDKTISFEPNMFSATKDYAFVLNYKSNREKLDSVYGKAAEYLNSIKTSGPDISSSDLNSSNVYTKRLITISVKPSGSKYLVEEEIKYEGCFSSSLSIPGVGFSTNPAGSSFLIDSVSINAAGKEYETLENIYIYYFPAYPSGITKCINDEIIIKNTASSLDLSGIYIIKQKCPDYNDTLLLIKENEYEPKVSLTGIGETYTNALGATVNRVHTNYKTNLSKNWSVSSPPPAHSDTVGVAYDSLLYNNESNYLNYSLDIKVYDSLTRDFIYEMNGSMNSSKDKR